MMILNVVTEKMSNNDYREEIRITGSGSIGGGQYGAINISGTGQVTGDATAEEVFVAGSGEFKGDLYVEELEVTGKCRVEGRLEADSVTVRGSLHLEETMKVGRLRSYGSLGVEGDLISDTTYFAGSSNVAGNVECDSFTSRGSFSIDGLLTADEIDIWLGSGNHAEKVGGEKIDIRKKGVSDAIDREKVEDGVRGFKRGLSSVGEKLGFDLELDESKISSGVSRFTRKIDDYLTELGGGVLETSVVEGDTVELEGVEADSVRGDDLVIGEGCVIGKLEYSNTVEVKEGAEVGEKSRI